MFENVNYIATPALLLYIVFCCVLHPSGFDVRKLTYLRLQIQNFYSWVWPPPNHQPPVMSCYVAIVGLLLKRNTTLI